MTTAPGSGITPPHLVACTGFMRSINVLLDILDERTIASLRVEHFQNEAVKRRSNGRVRV